MPRGGKVYRIFIVEDHSVMRETFCELVGAEEDMEVCGVAASGEAALATFSDTAPDLLLVDLSLPDINGFEVIRRLHDDHPTLKALIVSGHPVRQYQELAKRGGAVGYIDKVDAYHVLVPTIREVLRDAG